MRPPIRQPKYLQQIRKALADQLGVKKTRSKLLSSLALVASTFALPLGLRPFIAPTAPPLALQTAELQLNQNGVYNYDPLTPSIVPNFEHYEGRIIHYSAELKKIADQSNLKTAGKSPTPAQSIPMIAAVSEMMMSVHGINAELQNASDPSSIIFNSSNPAAEQYFEALKTNYLLLSLIEKNYLNILVHLVNYILRSRPPVYFLMFQKFAAPRLTAKIPELSINVLTKDLHFESPPHFKRQVDILLELVKFTKETEIYALFRHYNYLAALFLICSSLAAYRFILPSLFQKAWSYYAPNAIDVSLDEIADQSPAQLSQTQRELNTKEKQLERYLALVNPWLLYPSYGFIAWSLLRNAEEYGLSAPLVPYFASLALQSIYERYAAMRESNQLNATLEKNRNCLAQAFQNSVRIETTTLGSAPFFTLEITRNSDFSTDENFELVINSLEKQGVRICHHDEIAREILLFADQKIPVSLAEYFARSCELRKKFSSLKNEFKHFHFRMTEEMNLQAIFNSSIRDQIKNIDLGPFQITREKPIILELAENFKLEAAIVALNRIAQSSIPASEVSSFSGTRPNSFEPAPSRQRVKTRAVAGPANAQAQAALPKDAAENIYPLIGHTNPRARIKINFRLDNCYGDEVLFNKLVEKAQQVARGWFGNQGVKFFGQQHGGCIGEIKILGEYGDVRVGIRKVPQAEAPLYETDSEVIFGAHRKAGWGRLLRFGS